MLTFVSFLYGLPFYDFWAKDLLLLSQVEIDKPDIIVIKFYLSSGKLYWSRCGLQTMDDTQGQMWNSEHKWIK